MVEIIPMRHRQAGFSLIELLIVVGIILIITSIAIPSFMRARMSANESAAAHSIRTINTAEVSYFSTYPTVGFAPLLALGAGGATPCVPSSAAGCFIDDVLANNGHPGGTGKDGYSYSIGNVSLTSYTSLADPISLNQTGSRSFCSDQTGVIWNLTGATGCLPGTAPATAVQ
jgi:prepilin-type N-terminal cleavage/methylation domain-containing protein